MSRSVVGKKVPTRLGLRAFKYTYDAGQIEKTSTTPNKIQVSSSSNIPAPSPKGEAKALTKVRAEAPVSENTVVIPNSQLEVTVSPLPADSTQCSGKGGSQVKIGSFAFYVCNATGESSQQSPSDVRETFHN